MLKRLNQRQVFAFFCVLIALFILVFMFLPRPSSPYTSQPPTQLPSTLAAPSPSSRAPNSPSPSSPSPTPVPTLSPETASQCREQIKPFLAQSDPLVSEWVDDRRQADRVLLEALPAEIEKLKSVRQRVHALQVPLCVEGAFLSLLESMDRSIEAYQGFVAQLPEERIRADLTQASEMFDRYVEQIDRVR
jgi:hypothetical protein